MSEETLKTKYWLGAVLVPGLVIALTFVVARFMPASEGDWLGGRFMLLALVGTGVALLSSIVLTFASVKRGVDFCGWAVVSCVAYVSF
jgi:multisubunit Na+/H+ antiporter MnhB subunit